MATLFYETVDGKNHQTLEMSTGAKVKAALDKLVNVKSEDATRTND